MRTLSPLFAVTITSTPTVPRHRSSSLYGVLKNRHLKDKTPSQQSLDFLPEPRKLSDETTSLFWSMIYTFVRDILEIRTYLNELVTTFECKEISLMAVYPIIHTAFYMIEERTAALLDEEPKLRAHCPKDFLSKYQDYGIVGIIHFAFQGHEGDARKETELMTRTKQQALAKVGLDFFLSPTVAKLLQYRLLKSEQDANFLVRLAQIDDPIPYGDALNTENNQVLVANKDGALYDACWYEDTMRVLLREFSRMASLDKLVGQPRFPIHDALTGILSQSLLGLSKKHEDLSATCLFHIVLDIQKRLAANGDRMHNEAQKVAQRVDTAFNEYYQCVEEPSHFLKSPVEIARKLILVDPMTMTPKFGPKRLRAFRNADPVLGSAGAHLAQSPPNALKRYNPALSGHLAFAALDGFRKGTAHIDEMAPNTVAFLFLYIGLKVNDCLSKDYPDAEQVIDWFGEQSVFGTNGRPRSTFDIINRLRALINRSVRWDLHPEAEIETLFHPFLADNSKENYDNLQAYLTTQYRASPITKAADASETKTGQNFSESQSKIPRPTKVKLKLPQKSEASSSKPTPRPIDLLATMQSLYTRDIQLRASFNFLAFRTRVTPILEHCARLLLENNFGIPDKHSGEPDELLRFIDLFWAVQKKVPRQWAIVKDDVVEMIEDVVANKGRMEVDAAEQMCGWKE